MGVSINLILGIISQCTGTSSHRVVHAKYIIILFVDNTSVELEKNNHLCPIYPIIFNENFLAMSYLLLH